MYCSSRPCVVLPLNVDSSRLVSFARNGIGMPFHLQCTPFNHRVSHPQWSPQVPSTLSQLFLIMLVQHPPIYAPAFFRWRYYFPTMSLRLLLLVLLGLSVRTRVDYRLSSSAARDPFDIIPLWFELGLIFFVFSVQLLELYDGVFVWIACAFDSADTAVANTYTVPCIFTRQTHFGCA